ncbi:MAG TPA: DHA2 family efflux MFS transporter permease subunit [Gaiellaceae bacterium]|jgi:EmrB/QacA subfamily drug resistance transporter|nr:DHA2 family efflux MFS transporter permease subunit [Gaiellaceae bacterium]
MVDAGRKKWFALALILAVQFMTILDIAIVNVALPSIQVDLGFSQENLQWVISAYALVFGGFLLLGGRSADLLGRRRVFMFGTIIFTVGSLLCGLAWSEESLIAFRALQGLGAATITPAALSILVTTFAEGRERNIALGAWGAVGGFGAAAGVLFGGILTDLLSWEWIFFVNVPVGVAALILTPFLLSESLDKHGQGFDALGAILVTSGLSLLVLGITQGHGWGWTSPETIGVFAASAVLLLAFIGWEQRAKDPLVPFSIFRLQTLTAANVVGFILGTALFAMFLMLTLYMQQVLGLTPIETGVGYLAVAGTAIIWANVAAALVTRVGVKPSLVFGMAVMTVGLLYFTQVSASGSYWTDLFPGFLLIGLGLPFGYVAVTIAAVAGTKPQEAGLASGLINTSQQIGGAVGIAILSTIAVSTTDDALATGTAAPVALTDGFQAAFWAGAAITFAGVLVSLFMVRGRDLQEQEVRAPEPALDGAAG